MKRPRFSSGLCGLAALAAFGGQDLHAQGTAFMYQGRPNNGGTPANGSDDFRFSVYDSVTNGSLIAGPVTNIATTAALLPPPLPLAMKSILLYALRIRFSWAI